MLSVQEKVLDLLIEIDEICKTNGIKYSLTEKTASMAEFFGGFQSNEYLAEIMMTASDFKKFSELVAHKNNPDRVLESWENNSKMPSLCARYVNTQTMLWDTTKGNNYKYKGIFVQINILRTNSNDNIITKAYEKIARWNNVIYLRYVIMYAPFSKRKYTLLALMLIFARIVLVNSFVSKIIFNKLLSCKEDGKRELFYTNLNGKRRKFNHDVLTKTKEIEFENHVFQIVSDSQKLIKVLYKEDAEKHARKTDYSAINVDAVIDTILPYETVMSKAEKENIYSKKQLKKKVKYEQFVRFVLNPNKAKADKQWRCVQRTVDRFGLWELYTPQKAELMDLYERNELEQLKEVLSLYFEKTDLHLKRNLGLCFDTDILNIACDILKKEGKTEKVNKLLKLIPDVHKENLSDYLIKQGVTHELLGNTHGEN